MPQFQAPEPRRPTDVIDVTTEYALAISQCKYIIFMLDARSQDAPVFSSMITAFVEMIDTFNTTESILCALSLYCTTAHDEITVCRLTGCKDEVQHDLLNYIITIIHDSRDKVINKALSFGLPPNQSMN